MIEMPTDDDPVKVIQGDCLDVLRRLPDKSISAVITDPPYGVSLGSTKGSGGAHGLKREAYLSFSDTYEEYMRVVPDAITESIRVAERVAVFIGPHIWELPKADAIGGVYMPNAAARHGWGFKNFLPVLFYGTAPDLHKGVREHTVIRSTTGHTEGSGHPCPKPLEWMRWLVRIATRPGELILDPFAGSGTTGAAAMREGRKCILIEKEPAYCEIIRRRLSEAGTLFAGM
jgi:DNA modification methylase